MLPWTPGVLCGGCHLLGNLPGWDAAWCSTEGGSTCPGVLWAVGACVGTAGAACNAQQQRGPPWAASLPFPYPLWSEVAPGQV